VSESASKANHRSAIWYLKWVFASFACGFGLTLLVCTLALPFAGHKLFQLVSEPEGTAAMFALMVLSAPVLYRHLK
jgi:hypothetical protein